MRSQAWRVLLLGACVPVWGQITCTLQKDSQVTIRKEGCDELVEVKLVCTGGFPTPAGQPVPPVDVTFTSSGAPIGVTIESLNLPSSYSQASMVVDTPPPGNVKFGNLSAVNGQLTSYNGPPIDGVGGSGLNYTDGSVPNAFVGFQNGQYSITFKDVPLDPSTMQRTLTIQFWVRACYDIDSSSQSLKEFTIHAFLIGFGGLNHDGQAIRTAAHPADSRPTVETSPLDLGGIVNCFANQFTTGAAPANSALNASLLGSSPTVPSAASAKLTYNTLFPGCLRVRATGFQDDVTQLYDTDLGITAPGFPSPFANFGTELQAVFNNIPAGVSVLVQSSVTSSIGAIMLTSPGTVLGSTGLTKLPVTNGSATAIWETQSASTTATGQFAIPVYFAYQAGVTAPSNITVVQSLASPPGGVVMAQPPANVLQPVLFSINTGTSATPKLTATLDSRPCIVGVTFWTNNACSPGSGLLANIVSDSSSALLQSPTFTGSGGVTFLALSNSTTPAFTQIFPKASNATPGTYQETMTITGAGVTAAAPLTVPFTVIVLPPNNPVFELNAVFDAFSYQAETIAPGQIYTIFGTNFGPATLTTGTLDASGKLGTTIADTQVLFDGIPSPLLYAASGQLSGVAPFELTGKASTNVQIVYNGLKSPVVALSVVPAAISIASADGSGGNGAVVLNADGSLNSDSNRASVGDTVVIYASYSGPFANGVTGTDGRTTTGAPYPAPAGTPSVSIGGVTAVNIPYFGNAPGFLESVMQINVVIPAGVSSSAHNVLTISAGGVTSPPWTTIAVK